MKSFSQIKRRLGEVADHWLDYVAVMAALNSAFYQGMPGRLAEERAQLARSLLEKKQDPVAGKPKAAVAPPAGGCCAWACCAS